jgi:O-glycosyl hydrolase
MVNTNDRSVSNWPFPSKDNPLTPWTPEQQRKYAEEQLKKLPESPL